jgi:competence protein ComEA
MNKLMKTLGLAVGLLMASVAHDAHAGGKAKSHRVVSGVLNLNAASAAQLDQLPGVGEKAAARIIEYRKKTPFTRPEEIVKVKGFGKKKFEKLKSHLAVSGATTLTVRKEPIPEGGAQGRAAPAKR